MGWLPHYCPPFPDVELKLNWRLTDEQKYMAKKISDNSCGVIHMGTGRGKSWVIYNTIIEKKCRTLILCHNIKTADDMYAGLLKNIDWLDESMVWLVHSKSKHPMTWCIDVMTHASFVKTYKQLQCMYDMILYDECDYNLSFPVRWDFHCMVCGLIELSTKYLYWFTWTPYRAEGWYEVLNRIFGEIRTYCSEYNYTPTITQIMYQYDWDYDFENFAELLVSINESEDRHKQQVNFINKNKRNRNLVLVKTIKESEELHKDIPNSILMNWQLKLGEESVSFDLINKAIENGTGFTIVGTIDKIGRGVDIPPIDTLFLFSPVRFRWTVVQAVGRALRKYPDKNDVRIFDWCDMPILKKQQVERLKCYSKEYWINKQDFLFITI